MDLASDRIAIRPWTLDDVDALHAILSDPITMSFWPAPFTREQTNAWIERSIQHYEVNGYSRCALIYRADGLLIGDIGLLRTVITGLDVVDLGYIVDRRWWGQGIATEGAIMTRDSAFAAGLGSLHANMATNHLASRRVAAKIGMREVLEFDNPRNRGIRTVLMEVRRDWLLEPP